MFDNNRRVVPAEVLPELAAAVAGLPAVAGGGSAIEAGALILAATMLERQLAGWRLAMIDAFHTQGSGEAWGSSSTAGFLRSFTQIDGAHATALVGAAKTARQLPRFAGLLGQGKIGVEHLQAVTKHVKELPEQMLAEADRRLWNEAGWARPGDLRRVARKLHEVWDDQQTQEDDRHLHEARYLNIVATFGGAYSVEGMLEPEQGATVLAALGSLTAPRGLEDTRTAGQRRADAFVELTQVALRSGQLPEAGGDRTRVTIVVHTDTPPAPAAPTAEPEMPTLGRWATRTGLHGAAPARILGTPVDLSPSALDRVCCDADIAILLLDGNGEVLNLGRTARDTNLHQRRALAVRDGGCVFPDCGRAPTWCHAHHLKWWQRDHGSTDLDNLALLCSFHHHLIHDHNWLLQRIPPGDQARPAEHTGQAWQATSPNGLVLREFRQQVA